MQTSLNNSSTDVLIVGGGPVGMVLACELLRHGLSVRIVDKAAETKKYSRAPVFWPRAQEALELMGLHHLWNGTSVPLRRMNVNVYGRPAGVVPLDRCESAKPVPMLVGQDVTERLLDAHLSAQGVAVERSTEATSMVLGQQGATVTLRRAGAVADIVQAHWLIGCDGTDSAVRNAVGLGWDGRQLTGVMVPVADARAKWGLPDGDGDAYVALTPGGYFLAIPLPGCWRVIVATKDTTPTGQSPYTDLNGVEALTSRAIGGPVRLRDADWVSVVRYGNYMAPRFRAGRAVIAGDAAHSIAPLSGQGMNVGVQDAFDLAWKLAYVHKGWARDELLDTYTADRLPVAARLVRFTNRFFDNVLNPSRTQRTIRRVIAPLVLGRTRVQRKIAGFYTGTDIVYTDSPLNDTDKRRMPRPGHFARDGSVVGWPSLDASRFFDHLKGLHWSVVLFSGRTTEGEVVNHRVRQLDELLQEFGCDRLRGVVVVAATTATGVPTSNRGVIVLDAWYALHEKYKARNGGLVLVRPDGYVAFNRRAEVSSIADLARLLERVLVRDSN